MLIEGTILDGLRITGHVAANRFGDLHGAVDAAGGDRRYFVQEIAGTFAPTPEWLAALHETFAVAVAARVSEAFLRVRAPADGALWVAWEDLDGPNLSDIIGPGGLDNVAKLAWFKHLLEALARSLADAAETGLASHEISLAPEHIQIAFRGTAPPLRELNFTSTERWPPFEVRLLPLCLDYFTADFLRAGSSDLDPEHLRSWLGTPLLIRFAALIYGILTRTCSAQGCPPRQFRPVSLGAGGNKLNAALRALFAGKMEAVHFDHPRALLDPLALLEEFIPTAVVPPPNAPILRSATPNGGSITLFWTDVRLEENFIVERAGSDGDWVEVVTLPKDSTTFIHHEAGLGTWEYRILASNAGGRSKPSNSKRVEVRPSAAPVMASLEVRGQAAGQVQLEWSTTGDTAVRFELQRRLAPSGEWGRIAEPNGAGTAHLDASVEGGRTYDYRIRVTEPAPSDWLLREGVRTERGGSIWPRVAMVAVPLLLAGGAGLFLLTKPGAEKVAPEVTPVAPVNSPTVSAPSVVPALTARIAQESSIAGLSATLAEIESATTLATLDRATLVTAARAKLGALFGQELDRHLLAGALPELANAIAALRASTLTPPERQSVLQAVVAKADAPLQTMASRIGAGPALPASIELGDQLWSVFDLVTQEAPEAGKLLADKVRVQAIFDDLAELLDEDGRARQARTHYEHAIAVGSVTASGRLAELYRILQGADVATRRAHYELGVSRGDPKAMVRFAIDDAMQLPAAQKSALLARAEPELLRQINDPEAAHLLGELYFAGRAIPETAADPAILKALPFFERARGSVPAAQSRWVYYYQTINPNTAQHTEAVQVAQLPNSPVRWILTKRALAQQRGQAALNP